RWINWLIRLLVAFVRNTPLIMQLMFVYFIFAGIPGLVNIPALVVGFIVIGIHYSTYMSESYRAGIDAVPPGQHEAATALSLPPVRKFTAVVLPQALRATVPSLGNYAVAMFKDTPFLFAISVVELVTSAQQFGAAKFAYTEAFTLAGIVFLAASYPTSLSSNDWRSALPPTENTPSAADASAASASSNPAIEFKDVEKSFGKNTVLKNLNFTVAPGERVTLIGPSGSGKTTILRLVMTLEELTNGYIFVDGQPLTFEQRDGKRVELPKKRTREITTRIGMVFQQFNLFPNMTVLENIIEAPVHVLGKSKAEASKEAKELLERVGLAEKADEHPTRLSGGQQQRVAIARALAMSPEILLLDEVTSALDPELVGDVLAVLRDIAETTDITMLLVTHEMQFARDVSHRVMMFDGGQVLE